MVALVIFVPHALVWVDAVGLPAVEFIAVGASVLFGFVILTLLLFLTSSMQIGMLGFLAIVSTRFELLL